ncbi:MAG TPA: VWA domain-containing protein [Candidatus Limnocylindrales bacterium]|nr:VWA domain-containing protein [Candidatus Limnocylindrales bacterium]
MQTPPGQPVKEDSRSSANPLQSRANLVPVRVIVRDSNGRVVPGLKKEDFRVFEDGKRQDISLFLSETPASFTPVFAKPDAPPGMPASIPPTAPDFVPPSRFVGLVFDDGNSDMSDLIRSRAAAERYIDQALRSSDRVAIFTLSGRSGVDFTNDRAKLDAVLKSLTPQVLAAGDTKGNECPPIDYFEADRIENKDDQRAFDVAVQDTLACAFSGDPHQLEMARQMARAASKRILSAGEAQTRYAFLRLTEILHRISTTPGTRSLVLVSPGFIFPGREYDLSQMIDRANREGVFINTLDARGLYTSVTADVSKPNFAAQTTFAAHLDLRNQAQTAQSDVLGALADGTGGMAFHDNNDLTAGLQSIAAPPEVSYVVGFVPHDLKYDGRFHSLKVTLATNQHLQVQARRGFYAPAHPISLADAATQEIDDAVYSLGEQHDLPVELHTQYQSVDPTKAKLAVMTQVDISHVHFLKAAGRNQDDLTVVAALFNRDGRMVNAIQKNVELNLLDKSLADMTRSGVTVKTDFDVVPGNYLVRLVVRDSNSDAISAENGVVEIP